MQIKVIQIFPLLSFINILIITNSQPLVNEEMGMKAFSCVTVINNKFKELQKPDSNLYSPAMLACYMKITEEQVNRILDTLETNEVALTDDEMNELTNTESIRGLPEETLKEKSRELEAVINDFERIDDEFSKLGINKNNDNNNNGEDDDDEDDENQSFIKRMIKKIKRGINSLFNKNGVWYTMFAFLFIYFAILVFKQAGKIEEARNNEIKKEEKENKDNIIKDNKNNIEKGSNVKDNSKKEKTQ